MTNLTPHPVKNCSGWKGILDYPRNGAALTVGINQALFLNYCLFLSEKEKLVLLTFLTTQLLKIAQYWESKGRPHTQALFSQKCME